MISNSKFLYVIASDGRVAQRIETGRSNLTFTGNCFVTAFLAMTLTHEFFQPINITFHHGKCFFDGPGSGQVDARFL